MQELCGHTCFLAARRAAADRCRRAGGDPSTTACRISSAAAGSGTGDIGTLTPSGPVTALTALGCASRPYLDHDHYKT